MGHCHGFGIGKLVYLQNESSQKGSVLRERWRVLKDAQSRSRTPLVAAILIQCNGPLWGTSSISLSYDSAGLLHIFPYVCMNLDVCKDPVASLNYETCLWMGGKGGCTLSLPQDYCKKTARCTTSPTYDIRPTQVSHI